MRAVDLMYIYFNFFVGIKAKYRQTQLNAFLCACLFYYCLLAKLYLVILLVYRRKVLKYRNMIFMPYRPVLFVSLSTYISSYPFFFLFLSVCLF